MNDEQAKRYLPVLEEIQNIAYWLADRGWSEANGGNISCRLTGVPGKVENLTPSKPIRLPMSYKGLKGFYFVITGAGCRMRDTARALEHNIGIIRITEDEEHYECLWGNDKPTSELPSHLAIQQVFVRERPELTSIVHTHPVSCIALTHLAEMKSEEKLNNMLLRMQHETKVFLHDGIAVLDYFIPGSIELGLASAEKLKNHRVLFWDKHGTMAAGESPAHALDLLEVTVKAADIFWQVYGAGKHPEGLTDEQIRRTSEAFGLS